MSFHVQRQRIADTSVSNEQGGVPATPGIGSVRHSKTFATAGQAQREADAWNGAGRHERHGPTDWRAIVVPGRAPVADAQREAE
jgi:hypothetical protein